MTYKIGICELYNRRIHGPGVSEDKIMVSFIITNEEFFTHDYLDYLRLMKDSYNVLPVNFKKSNIIRNYKYIIENNKYYTCNLIKEDTTNEPFMSCVIKTGGLIWLQKKWKKKFKKNKELIKKMRNINNIRSRELNGYYS